MAESNVTISVYIKTEIHTVFPLFFVLLYLERWKRVYHEAAAGVSALPGRRMDKQGTPVQLKLIQQHNTNTPQYSHQLTNDGRAILQPNTSLSDKFPSFQREPPYDTNHGRLGPNSDRRDDPNDVHKPQPITNSRC